MTGLVRKATLMGACGMLVAAAAFANVPSPGNSDAPAGLILVGTHRVSPVAGQVSEAHTNRQITITVRDFTNTPVASSPVVLDFTACTDTRLCPAAVINSGTVACGPPGTVSATTNGLGEVTITVVGAANNPSAGASSAGVVPPCVVLRAGGQDLRGGTSGFPGLIAAVANQNGRLDNSGVTGGDGTPRSRDITAFLGSGTYVQRTDYDLNGSLAGADAFIHSVLVLQSLTPTGSNFGCDDGKAAVAFCP